MRALLSSFVEKASVGSMINIMYRSAIYTHQVISTHSLAQDLNLGDTLRVANHYQATVTRVPSIGFPVCCFSGAAYWRTLKGVPRPEFTIYLTAHIVAVISPYKMV